MSIIISIILIINTIKNIITLILLIIVTSTAFSWWRDVYRESTEMGEHSKKVSKGLKSGIILFILSEILFFVSFFWSFFHSRITPAPEIGLIWPPNNIQVFDPMGIPLLNTILLLSSGITITWAHNEIIIGNIRKLGTIKKSLIITVLLGIIFSVMQGFEYLNAPFTITDSIFGTTFFIITGFHGVHVILGTTFLMVSYKRLRKLLNSHTHFLTFEISAWYWHFVDVVWLFLYSIIYWWGM